MKIPLFSRRPRRLGVALGGGAVRGAAHLGVLSVLEEYGIRPTALAGTSVGAILGAGFAAGFTAAALLEVFRDLNWFSLVGLELKIPALNLLSAHRLERLLRQRLGLTAFSDLGIPFRAVACDLISGDTVALSDGDLVEAILASSALPGLFPPIQRDGRLLVDGGLVENLPVGVVREMGAERVLAVDLLPPPSPTEPPQNLLEVWQRSLYLLIRGSGSQSLDAEVLIQPEISGYPFSDFSHVDELFAAGRRAARAALPAIRAALAARG